jgi:hypothetical protein
VVGRPQRIVPTGLEWYRLVFGSVLVSVFAATELPFPAGRISFLGVVIVTFGFAIAWGRWSRGCGRRAARCTR